MVGKFRRLVTTDPLFAISLTGWLLFLAAGSWIYLGPTGINYQCPFKGLTGLPCPSCGTTRMVTALASFDLSTAFYFQPLGLLSLLTVLGYLPLTLGLDSFYHSWPRAHLRLAVVIFLCLALLNWLYLLFMGH